MTILKIYFVAACLMAATEVSAQKVKLISGDLSALQGVKTMNVQFDYGSMIIGKNKKEADYIKERKETYNKKEAGKGDQWEESWYSDRAARFEPQFREEFEKQSGLRLDPESASARYSIIFRTTQLEPGFNIGVTRKNAEIDGEVWIIENANSENVIAKISVKDCPGRTFGGYDFDTGERIKEAYAVAGKGLGKFLKKKV